MNGSRTSEVMNGSGTREIMNGRSMNEADECNTCGA